jgi:4-diphosphocytidyl-2-C-methyl-D-erythritol kinase
MLCFPNAKINIGLHVLRRMPDGYHHLETVFCPVALADVLEFLSDPSRAAGSCTFQATGIPLDGGDTDNLVVKAYRILSKDFPLPAVRIHLHKIIPPGAGLGGGSSDGAFMLKALNTEFNLRLSEEALHSYASELGSDCAFFFRNIPVFAYERGNRFRDLQRFPASLQVALINPGIHISTAQAYQAVVPKIPAVSLESLIGKPIGKWKNEISNDFERVMSSIYPKIAEIKDKLYKLGAVYAAMSGSGSTVFGLFETEVPALDKDFPGYFHWKGVAKPA